jgi:hypothetical protein
VRARGVAPGDEQRTRRGDLCHGHGRRPLSSDAGRVGRGTDDHEIVVHDVAPVDAVTVGYETIFERPRVNHDELEAAGLRQFERRAGARAHVSDPDSRLPEIGVLEGADDAGVDGTDGAGHPDLVWLALATAREPSPEQTRASNQPR